MGAIRAILKHSFFFLLLFISYDGQANAQDSIQLVLDSLLEVHKGYEAEKKTHELLELNISISEKYKELSDYPSALNYAEKALAIQDVIHNYSQKAKIYFEIGYAHEWLNDYQKALEYYDLSLEAEEVAEEIDVKQKGVIFGRKASVFKSLGKYEKSYDNQLNSIQIAETLKDTYDMAAGYYHLGSLFYYQKQYEKALEYYLVSQGLAVHAKEGEKISYACLAALGTTYQALGQIEKSLEYNLRSLKVAEDLGHRSGIAYSLSNIGSIYISMKEYDKAGKYFEESVDLKKELKDKWGLIGTYRSMADLASTIGNHKKAISYLKNAYSIALEIDSKPRQLEILDGFYNAYKKVGNYELALSYMEQNTALKDSVLNKITLEKMGNLKENYELEKKETEILIAKNENEVLVLAQDKNKLFRYLVTVVALFFGLLMMLSISRYRAQKKSSELLKGKNEEINRQNSELQKVNELILQTNNLLEQNKLKIEEQNKALESSNEDLRNFASVASHDLKEPLRMIHSYTTLLERRYNDKLDESGKEFMHFVIDAVDRMKTLLDDLLDYSRSGKQEMPDTLVSVNDAMAIVGMNLQKQIEDHNGSLVIKEENLPEILAHKSQLMQLLQNLVSNGLKFRGERDPVVTVDCEKKNNQFVFSVKDNGIGISKNNLDKVFEMFRRLHTREEYAGTGIGLATCKKIVSNMGGDIWVESVEGEGSSFFFAVPCPTKTPVTA